MNFSWEFIRDNIGYIISAAPMTLFLTVFPVIAGVVLGFGIALIRIHKVPVLSQLFGLYISFFRSVPLLVLLFVAYYGTPKFINFVFYGGVRKLSVINLNNTLIAIITLTLYSSAFLSEIIRGAFSSVDMRQHEAAHALGMTGFQTYWRILIPQAIVVALPNYFNFFLALLKGTAVVFTISVIDMMSAAKLQAEIGYRFIEAYVLVGVFYILFSVVFSRLFIFIEKKQKAGMGMSV
ncbi:MAG: amino acid ABC transporter permease [Treponema sp.]|nr:amino acid ABC transporter permease [Treponema sp.]